MQPTYVTFAGEPASVANAVLRIDGGAATGGHLVLGADGSVEMTFEVPAADAGGEATLQIVALVSKLGGEAGFAPLDITVNDRCLVHDWRIPGGGDLPQHMDFAVPAGRLRPGANRLRLATAPESHSMLWLYRITIDAVFDRDRSARAIDRREARRSSRTSTAANRACSNTSPGRTPPARSTRSRSPPSWTRSTAGAGRPVPSRRTSSVAR
jgi:hypothetical protein